MPFKVDYPTDAAERVEGEPFYTLQRYSLVGGNFQLTLRSYKELPLSDAVGLLDNVDSTGLIVWGGALAMLEWFLTPDSLLSNGRVFDNTVAIVELGCGSGVVSLGLKEYFGQQVKGTSPTLVITDGNDECISLVKKNVDPLSQREGVFVDLLQWGNEEDSKRCYAKCAGVEKLIVVSADVIYSKEAIQPLNASVRALAALHRQAAGQAEGSFEWWLVFTPRSLTREENESNFKLLCDELSLWSTYTVVPLPKDSLKTGFEGVTTESDTALNGCGMVITPTSSFYNTC